MSAQPSENPTTPTPIEQRPASESALPDGYHVEGGRLHLHGLDLASLADYWMTRAGQEDAPLTIRYMPSVRAKFDKAREAFAQATKQTNYPGTIRLAYASKANANHAVIKAAMSAGADYECSSRVDVSIVRYAIEQGWLTPDRLVIANGFKTPGYADALIGVVQAGHWGVIPVFDSIEEVQHFADSGIPLNVGMRYRVSGHNERFGMDEAELFETQELLAQSPNLSLVLFHALQLFPAIDNPEYVASLENAIEVFKRLRVCCPTLHWFDVGGGLPTELAEPDDLQEWMASIQQMALRHCGVEHAPDLIIESGRYLTGSHQLEAFRVAKSKCVNGVTYYILGGGIMSNLPDAWALGAEFPVAALNHCDAPYHDVRLAGLTCDPDDVYPPKHDKFVSLPQDADGLLVGFLDVGAYQDMLGGEGGAKHCLLSEGATILIGDDPEHPTRVTYQPPQSTEAVLSHLGYGQEPYSAF